MSTKLRIEKLTFAKINVNRRRGRKLATKFWVCGLPYDKCGRTRCGPYNSYADAKSDRDGMQRIFTDGNFK